ncbi:MAG: helix-turn-helix domain-containing protein [Firmicutes bacterium]|nr:helix-turn-helix domain-containing protein [Bacillota bacterium]
MGKTRIKELREEKNLSQEQLGKEIGFKPNTISNWERGTRDPDIDTIKKLCQFFDVTAGYLLGLED